MKKVNLVKEKNVSVFKARCGSCFHDFEMPQLSAMQSYGEYIFSSEDGKVYAYAHAFSASSKLIQVILPKDIGAENFQVALAGLADRILGRSMTNRKHCPSCHSTSTSALDTKVGEWSIPEVQYSGLISMDRDDVIEHVLNFAKENFS